MPLLRRPGMRGPDLLERPRSRGEGPRRSVDRIFRPEEPPGPFVEPRPPQIDEENGFYFVFWRDDEAPLRSLNSPVEMPKPVSSRAGNACTRGEWREMSQTNPRGDAILVGRSIGPELAYLKRLGYWLFAAGSSVLVLGLAGGWWVASRAIRPISNISSTAMEISSGDLSKRIPHSETESELGRLASILNSTFARLESAFAQQARFTADVSHELRTPITVILSQIQMTLARDRAPAPPGNGPTPGKNFRTRTSF